MLSDFSVRFAPQGHRPKRFRIVPDRRGQLLDHSYIGCAIDFFFFFSLHKQASAHELEHELL